MQRLQEYALVNMYVLTFDSFSFQAINGRDMIAKYTSEMYQHEMRSSDDKIRFLMASKLGYKSPAITSWSHDI